MWNGLPTTKTRRRICGGHEPESDGRRGPDAVRAILGRETSNFPGRLGIQHRDVPFAVANGLADAGLLVHRLALHYTETFSKEFAVVSLPGAEQR